MAHPSTLFATDGGAGLKDGITLARAAAIDPADANDIWTIVNGDVPAAGGTEIKLCADSPVTTTAKVEITVDAATADPFTVQGRTAADAADAQVVLDANNAAFPVIQLTTADRWRWWQITAQNTDRNTPNHAWDIGANADNCHFYLCRGLDSYRGFSFNSGASNCRLVDCEGSANANIGVSYASSSGLLYRCIADANGSTAFSARATCVGCISSNNTGNGYTNTNVAIGCLSYSDTTIGFNPDSAGAILIDCMSVDSSGHAVDAQAGEPVVMIRFAHHNNSSGLLNGTNAKQVGTIALSAAPFITPGSRDFRPNALAGGGLLLRNIAHAAIDGNWTSYDDIGAIQAVANILRHPGTSGGARG